MRPVNRSAGPRFRATGIEQAAASDDRTENSRSSPVSNTHTPRGSRGLGGLGVFVISEPVVVSGGIAITAIAQSKSPFIGLRWRPVTVTAFRIGLILVLSGVGVFLHGRLCTSREAEHAS